MNIYISNLSYGVDDADLTRCLQNMVKLLLQKLLWIGKLVDQEDSVLLRLLMRQWDKKQSMN